MRGRKKDYMVVIKEVMKLPWVEIKEDKGENEDCMTVIEEGKRLLRLNFLLIFPLLRP